MSGVVDQNNLPTDYSFYTSSSTPNPAIQGHANTEPQHTIKPRKTIPSPHRTLHSTAHTIRLLRSPVVSLFGLPRLDGPYQGQLRIWLLLASRIRRPTGIRRAARSSERSTPGISRCKIISQRRRPQVLPSLVRATHLQQRRSST